MAGRNLERIFRDLISFFNPEEVVRIIDIGLEVRSFTKAVSNNQGKDMDLEVLRTGH
jgi:hypothetical protein